MIVATCNLCNAVMPVDDLWENRASQHEAWHNPRKYKKALFVNTVHGDIHWEFSYDI